VCEEKLRYMCGKLKVPDLTKKSHDELGYTFIIKAIATVKKAKK